MFVFFDPCLADAIGRWDELKRWERQELGQSLRRLAFSYVEISRLLPVSKGTLSGWCRDLELTPTESQRLAQRQRELAIRGQVGRSRRYKTRDRAQTRRADAQEQVADLKDDPIWVAGLSLYWAEGGKSSHRLTFSNSDPKMVAFFITWACRYLDLRLDRFTISLHLHAGQNESERREFWARATGLGAGQFRKTFVKAEGSGHRKNILYNGTAQVRVTKSGALHDQVLGWIDGLRDSFLSSR